MIWIQSSNPTEDSECLMYELRTVLSFSRLIAKDGRVVVILGARDQHEAKMLVRAINQHKEQLCNCDASEPLPAQITEHAAACIGFFAMEGQE